MKLGTGCCMLLAMLAAPQMTAAQTYPTKPVRLITPTGAGGSLDTMARMVAQKLTEAWGQQVIIDNRPGSGGMLGAGAAARSAPDGYTLLLASNGNLATTQALYKNVPYDPVADFAPISLVASNPYVLVAHPSLPANNVRELVRLAKSQPGEINVASSGNGSTPHLALELLNTMAGIKLMHVPYKTSPAGLTSVVSGETSLMFVGVVAALPFVKTSRLRPLAVASDQRLSVLPDLPTIAASGVPGYEASNWAGLLAPAGTPQDVIARVHRDTVKTLQTPEMRQHFHSQGLEVVGSNPGEFAAFIKSEIAKWTKVIRESGAKVQ